MRGLAVAIVAVVFALACDTVSADSREDSAIRLEALSQLGLQPTVARERLDVTVQDGTVHLLGSVGTLFQKWRATDAVAHVKGVTRIVDELELRSGGGSDSALADDVRRRFDDMPALSRGSLTVDVSSGTVRIGGKLDDARMRFDARDAAAKVTGVVAVVDAISSGDKSDLEARGARARRPGPALGDLCAGGFRHPCRGRAREARRHGSTAVGADPGRARDARRERCEGSPKPARGRAEATSGHVREVTWNDAPD